MLGGPEQGAGSTLSPFACTDPTSRVVRASFFEALEVSLGADAGVMDLGILVAYDGPRLGGRCGRAPDGRGAVPLWAFPRALDIREGCYALPAEVHRPGRHPTFPTSR